MASKETRPSPLERVGLADCLCSPAGHREFSAARANRQDPLDAFEAEVLRALADLRSARGLAEPGEAPPRRHFLLLKDAVRKLGISMKTARRRVKVGVATGDAVPAPDGRWLLDVNSAVAQGRPSRAGDDR